MPYETFYRLNDEKRNRIIDAIIDEMSLNTYEHLNISNIVRSAKIPRGSFYQYFSGTEDLFEFMYLYIGKLKTETMKPLLSNDSELPFLDRFLEIYLAGIQFSKDNPKLMLVGKKMLISDYYKQNQYIKKGTDLSISIFKDMIESDQNKGKIRAEIDSNLLSKMLLETLTQLSIEEYHKEGFDFPVIENAVRQMVDILKKGIEPHV